MRGFDQDGQNLGRAVGALHRNFGQPLHDAIATCRPEVFREEIGTFGKFFIRRGIIDDEWLMDQALAISEAGFALVRRVRERARPALQEALRAECRLVLRTPEDSANNRPGAQVPIQVEPGYPVVLEHIQFSDDLARIMVLGRYRASLQQARNGASGLISLRDSLLELPESEKWVSATGTDLQSVAVNSATNRQLPPFK